jgi:NADPH-dependent curcumin reductase CurA
MFTRTTANLWLKVDLFGRKFKQSNGTNHMSSNRQWVLKERPTGMVGAEHYELRESPLPTPDLSAGEVLIKVLYLGFDPAMRGWVIDEPSYLPPVGIGEVMRASSVGQVTQSENSDLPVGTLVQGMCGWQEYAVGSATDLIPPMPLPEGLTPGMALSVFGMTSLTAYFGLLDVGQPVAGNTVLVSGAAGATGSVALQIAKLKGCRTIGIAGGTQKCKWLRESCGADEVIDYKSETVADRLAELCPAGIDVFFDNVGGDTLEAGIQHMADFGRIALCGGISGYNDPEPAAGPKNLMILVQRRIKMQGFIILDYLDRFEEGFNALAEWVATGDIAWREDVQEGFENIPATLQRLFSGANVGKQMLKLADPE